MSQAIACGIDFGTSNSAIGVVVNGEKQLIPLENGKVDMPTALFFNFEEQECLYGREAITDYIDGEQGRFMRAIKSTLGTPLMHDTTMVQGKRYSFIEIIAQYLAQLKKRAEKASGQVIDNVVLGRPVHFVDEDASQDADAQNALKQAAQQAGFKNIAFQFEPIAAAFSYEATIDAEKLALIVDIGGGTSDFSLVRVSPERHKQADRSADILATTGVHVGGTDYDKALSVEVAMPHFGYKTPYKDVPDMAVPSHLYHQLATWHLIHFMYEKQTVIDINNMKSKVADDAKYRFDRFVNVIENREAHHVALAVEQTKINLSSSAATTLDLTFLEKGLADPVVSETFESVTKVLCDKVEASMLDCLKKAGVSASDVGAVFLTGGTTSVTHLREQLLAHFPNAEVVDGDKFGSVAMGLTIQAASEFA